MYPIELLEAINNEELWLEAFLEGIIHNLDDDIPNDAYEQLSKLFDNE